MAVICKKCKGIIPDITFDFVDRNDCKNHNKIKPDIKLDFNV